MCIVSWDRYLWRAHQAEHLTNRPNVAWKTMFRWLPVHCHGKVTQRSFGNGATQIAPLQCWESQEQHFSDMLLMKENKKSMQTKEKGFHNSTLSDICSNHCPSRSKLLKCATFSTFPSWLALKVKVTHFSHSSQTFHQVRYPLGFIRSHPSLH